MAYATNSNNQYQGTIIAAPIRPAGPDAQFATVFSNEVKGTHHSYETIAERNINTLAAVAKREWGMLATVYNDTTSSNNKTYQLKYGQSSTNLSDNNNWVVYSPGGLDSSEWLDSVQELSYQPSVLTQDGRRFLVDTPGSGVWFSGQDGKIATWNLSGSFFDFAIPTDGQTVRVDNIKNIIYKFQGIYGSGGKWVKEIVNQVRYLSLNGSNGLTYSVNSTFQNEIDTYSFSVYYCDFNIANTGTLSISIDSLPDIEVKKLENNAFYSLSSGDIQPNIKYQLVVNDGGFLQTVLPSSSTTTIGSAEDNDYTDGLFTDFVPTTPIGTAVDRFNEILKYLVPASAPGLTSWSATPLSMFVDGGLSFDNSTIGFVSATGSPYGSVSKGGTFSTSTSSYRLGINSKGTQSITGGTYYKDITGVLNSSIPVSTQTPIPAYVVNSFGNAATGSLYMLVNGVTISSISLSSTSGAIDSTNSGATSGISVSAATSSLFSSGYTFDTFQNRTGTYLLKREQGQIVNGYNFIQVKHEYGNTSVVLNRYEWVTDPSTTLTTVTSPRITAYNAPSKKYLSGIQYYSNPLSFVYETTINNLFSNTFNITSQAIEYRDVSDKLSTTNNVTNTITTTTTPIFSPDSQYSKVIPNGGVYNNNATMIASMTFSVGTNRRRINESIGFALTAKRTVQGDFVGGTAAATYITTTNWYIDTYTTQSTTFSEIFTDERYRLNNKTSKYGFYHLVSDVVTGTWSSNISLKASAGPGDGYNNGLQIVNGLLMYPGRNFNNDGNADSNPNFGIGSSVDYSDCSIQNFGFGHSTSPTNNRSYTRWFYFGQSPGVGTLVNYPKAKLKIKYLTTTFVKSDVALTGNNAWIEIKLPYGSGTVPGGLQTSGSVTGWMDATQPFDPNIGNPYGDGAGCLEGSVPTTSFTDWLINFGQKGSEYSNGYVLLRITVGPSYTGKISQINLEPRTN